MKQSNLFENDQQFEIIINSHEKTEPEELVILVGQYSEQIKIFYSLKFTMVSWSNILHYLKSDKPYHQLYAMIGIRQLFSTKNHQIDQFIKSFELANMKELQNDIKHCIKNHPQLLYEYILVSKHIMLVNWSKFKMTIKYESICMFFIDLLKSQYVPLVENIIEYVKIMMQKSDKFQNIMQNKNENVLQNLLPVIKQNIHNDKISENGLQLLTHLLRKQNLMSSNKLKQTIKFIIECVSNYNFKLITTEKCFQILASQKCQSLLQQLNKQVSQKLMQKIYNIITTDFAQLKNIMEPQLNQSTKKEIKQELFFQGIAIIDTLIQSKANLKYFQSINGMNIIDLGLHSNNVEIRRFSCKIIQSISCQNYSNIEELFPNMNTFFKLKQMFQQDTNQIKKTIGYIFSSFSHFSDITFPFNLYKNENVFDYYVQLLSGNQDEIITGLICLEDALNVGNKFKENNKNYFIQQMKSNGSYKKVYQQLVTHENKQISMFADTIVSEIFFEDDPHMFDEEEKAAGVFDYFEMNNPAGGDGFWFGENEEEIDQIENGIDEQGAGINECESQIDQVQENIDEY